MDKIVFDNNIPIYVQIIQEIKKMIVSQKWSPGEKIDSVRDLAQKFHVNPNTMQRALAELEREGLLYAERTSGRFVTEDSALIDRMKRNKAKEEIKKMIVSMIDLGYSKEDIVRLFTEEIEGGSEKNGTIGED